MWELIWKANWFGWAILMIVILFIAWRCGKDMEVHSSELEKHTLEVIYCGGCGKPLTVPVPFKGINLCSDCKYNQSTLNGEESCGKR